MRRSWIFAWLTSGLAMAGELPEAPAGKAWKRVWADEFDGKEIDTAKKWDIPDQKRRDYWWRAKSAFLDGKGHLVLRTEQIDGKYYSPCVRTRGKYEKAFGFFTTRCKVPKSEGHWSAFWLYADPVNRVGDAGRDGTEIDIFEWPWRDGRVQHTLHWDGYGDAHRSAGHVSHPPGVIDGDWHTYSLWWSPEEYVFYVDGKEVWSTKEGGVCQVPLYLKLSTEIGEWAGDIRKAKLPDDFVVDYVRVYDLVDK